MYITNNPEIALIAENAGVDRIFVDLEYIGKDIRQGGMDTVQSKHTIDDIKNVRKVLTTSELLVRCNPIHEASAEYGSSGDEIDAIVESGADIIMLPYFKTAAEVRRFVELVDSRAKTMILIETPEAVEAIDDILDVAGVDEYFVGLNDLSLGYGKRFMFELLSDGTVENLCNKFRERSLVYGFGGIAAIGRGILPAEHVIAEHYRLGSSCVILSRSFCDVSRMESEDAVKELFEAGMKEIREYEEFCEKQNDRFFEDNICTVKHIISQL